MAGFRCDPLEALTRQLTFSPVAQRRRQIERAEELYWHLDPEQNYPLDDLIQRITQHKPYLTNEAVTLVGRAVRDDLLVMVEHLSATLKDRDEDFDPPALNLDELAERWNVSKKTISRYRRQGLFARKLLSPGGRQRLGFLVDSIERFEDRYASMLQRAGRFQRLGDSEQQRILAEARRLAEQNDAADHHVIEQLASSTGRSVEAIRLLLRSHDEQATEPIFPEHSTPLRPDQQQTIFAAYHRGESMAELARQYDRAPDAIYRALHLRHAAALRRLRIEYVSNATFELPDAEAVILGSSPAAPDELDDAERREQELHRVQTTDTLPPYLRSVLDRPVLDAENERILFVRLNYLKYLARRWRRGLDRYRPRFADLDRIETALRYASSLRHRLSRDYLRLVIAAAQKHALDRAEPRAQTLELIHLGHQTLLEAIEEHDVARGHRFSAYANWRLLRAFAAEQRWDQPALSLRSEPEPAAWPAVFSADLLTLRDAPQTRQHLKQLMVPLSDVQHTLIAHHLGLPDDGDQPVMPLTLAEAGKRLDLNPARARRLEHEALVVMRRHAERIEIQLDRWLPGPAW